MCHIFLLLPVLALPVFWLLPPGEASALYAVVLIASVGVYWATAKAMLAPVVSGTETLLRAVGVVRDVDGRKASVWVCSELWSAEPLGGAVAVGDAVEVVGVNGVVLTVRKTGRPMPAGLATGACRA